MEHPSGWVSGGIAETSYTDERAHDGQRSLRFRTSLRDEAHLRKFRNPWDSFVGPQGGYSYVERRFAEPQDWSGYNRISAWVYVHPAEMRTYCLQLVLENEGTVLTPTTINSQHTVLDLVPGKWNHVLFEMPHRKRDRINRLAFAQILNGHNPGESDIVTYDIDRVELQQVDADAYEGWQVAPGTIAYSHIGYRPGDDKVAWAAPGADEEFSVLDDTGQVVLRDRI